VGLTSPTSPHPASDPSVSSAESSATQDVFFNETSTPSTVQRDIASPVGTTSSVGPDQVASVSPPPAQFGIIPSLTLSSVVALTGFIVPSITPTNSTRSGDASAAERRQAGQGVPEPETFALPATSPGRDIEPVEVQAENSLQNAVSWLADSLPLDLNALDEALGRCLNQLGSAENTLSEFVENDGVWPWLTVAAIAATASVAAASWHQRSRAHPSSLILGDGTAFAPYDEPGARL